jgi:hypothetical protein
MHSSPVSSILSPLIFLNTLIQRSPPTEITIVLQTYKVARKIIGLYILIVIFIHREEEEKDSELNDSKHSPNLIYP